MSRKTRFILEEEKTSIVYINREKTKHHVCEKFYISVRIIRDWVATYSKQGIQVLKEIEKPFVRRKMRVTVHPFRDGICR